jgi:hypothetical protein
VDLLAGPSNPSFFALPSLENIEVDSKILNHFKVSTKEELFVLPQFSQPYVSDEKEFDQVLETQFVKYRGKLVTITDRYLGAELRPSLAHVRRPKIATIPKPSEP